MTTLMTRDSNGTCSWCHGSGRALDLPCPCTLDQGCGRPDCAHCSGTGTPTLLCVNCTGAYAPLAGIAGT